VDLREAARRTLATGTARVFERIWMEGAPDRLSGRWATAFVDRTTEGVADLSRARVRLDAQSWPAGDRLLRGPRDGRGASVFAGGAHFYVGEGPAVRFDKGAAGRHSADPTWILDALAGAREAEEGDREEVRGKIAARHPLVVDIERGRTLRGEIWVDDDVRIRRVTWTRSPYGRPRLRPRKPPPRVWRTTELWDFGLPVEIPMPS
jgi:hypothetical protein